MYHFMNFPIIGEFTNSLRDWIPTFVGMTLLPVLICRTIALDPHFRGDVKFLDLGTNEIVHYIDEITKSP